jgi:hypothetical protein
MLIAVGAPKDGTKGHGCCLLTAPGLLLKVLLKVFLKVPLLIVGLLKVPLLIVGLLEVCQFAYCAMTCWHVSDHFIYVFITKWIFLAPAVPKN